MNFKIAITTLLLSSVLTVNSQAVLPLKNNYQPNCDCDNSYTESDSTEELSAGNKVLKTGYLMSQVTKTIVQGSCWDFVNEVYRRAGVGDSKKTIFRSKKSGPFAPSSLVQPGDWIYHINHQFNNIEHSAIFVCWKDVQKKIAITLSYAGMNRKVPAKYGEYSLTSIYSIFRPNFFSAK